MLCEVSLLLSVSCPCSVDVADYSLNVGTFDFVRYVLDYGTLGAFVTHFCGDRHGDGLAVVGDCDKCAVYASSVAGEHVYGVAYIHTILLVNGPWSRNSGTTNGELVVLDVAVKDFGYAARQRRAVVDVYALGAVDGHVDNIVGAHGDVYQKYVRAGYGFLYGAAQQLFVKHIGCIF